MQRTVIVLPDGTELSSGAGAVNAIQSITLTECVNAGEELTLGSACANMLEAKLITPAGGLPLTAGDEVTLYKEDDAGTRYKVGLFTLEKPTHPTANTMSVTAYDRVSRLDRDLTVWLSALEGWPYTLYELAQMVCQACGLELSSDSIPNGEHPVQRFSADGITGRQLMQWIGEASGRFCRATADGKLEFAWYTPVSGYSIGPTGAQLGSDLQIAFDEDTGTLSLTSQALESEYSDGNLTLNSPFLSLSDDGAGNVILTAQQQQTQLFYYQNELRFEDYTVAAVEKVQIRQTEEDVGTVYPDVIGEKNTYIISGNPLLTASDAQELEAVAQTLYGQLRAVTYTPCTVTVPANLHIHAGSTVQITDRNGKTFTAYIMTKKQSGQRDTLECTGSPRRGSTTAVNNQTVKALSGKVLNLRADVDGLKASNEDTKGNLSALSLELGNISATVQQQTENQGTTAKKLTQLQQTAESVSLRLSSIEENGTTKVKTENNYTFDKDGLTISKSGEQMENRLDHTGMHVYRNSTPILVADSDGVEAVDVKVRNYLVVGKHARFEDYQGGTGCFWLD